jgi:hypothetical protein
MAEVDGNRTRQTGITRLTRFEGGGCHQVSRHLRRRRYRVAGLRQGSNVRAMKKLILLALFIGLGVLAAKKLREA